MRSIIIIACALVVAAGVGGCGAPPRADTPAPGATAAAPGTLYDRIRAAKRIRIGVKADTPPFGVRRGKNWTGFDIDIANAIARQLGIDDVDLVAVDSRNRDDKLIAGEVDLVVASYTITRYRERTIDFSIPYFQDGQALLVAADSPVKSYLDVAGKTVGVVKGSTSSYYLKQVAPDAKERIYPGFEQLIAGLRAHEVDAITSDRLILVGLIKLSADRDSFRIAGDRFTVEPYGIAMPQDQSRLRDAVNAALMEMWEDGSWKTIADTWFGKGATYESSVDFRMQVVPK
jgi:polar amino acid transport system substrate-binding protein